ncbi:MAG: hypothetical protein FWD68_08325 [Alphaproteobacteria bacterium]|nr:hypothetical protein [Alphaproteobacteria bacterium]
MGVRLDYARGLSWSRKTAAQGHPNLGAACELGNGVRQDYRQAIAWYRKSAEQRFSLAENHLAILYDESKGAARDRGQAAIWHRRATAHGYIPPKPSDG